jgi:hypothetical protein
MSEIEDVRESMEHAANEHAHGGVPFGRKAAMLIAVMAAMLAGMEFGAKDAQTAYLAQHVSASDTWSQYQGKAVRGTVLAEAADVMASLPNASDPAVAKRIEEARRNMDRMRSEPGADGMEQLAERARELEHARDHDMHRYHGFEFASSGLQLAIVLASVSVVTGIPALLAGAGLLAAAAAIYGLVTAFSVI